MPRGAGFAAETEACGNWFYGTTWKVCWAPSTSTCTGETSLLPSASHSVPRLSPWHTFNGFGGIKETPDRSQTMYGGESNLDRPNRVSRAQRILSAKREALRWYCVRAGGWNSNTTQAAFAIYAEAGNDSTCTEEAKAGRAHHIPCQIS